MREKWLLSIHKEIQNFLQNMAINDADPALIVKWRSDKQGLSPARRGASPDLTRPTSLGWMRPPGRVLAKHTQQHKEERKEERNFLSAATIPKTNQRKSEIARLIRVVLRILTNNNEMGYQKPPKSLAD